MKKKIYIIIGILLLIVLGIVIYNKLNSNNITDYQKIEHIISIKNNNKKIDAITGSFCYQTACIDKIDFRDFNYDILLSYYDDKLYIDNLDGNIYAIELMDYHTKEFVDIKMDFSNEYIITPHISGKYIFIVNAIYQSKKIRYYFMVDISENKAALIN